MLFISIKVVKKSREKLVNAGFRNNLTNNQLLITLKFLKHYRKVS